MICIDGASITGSSGCELYAGGGGRSMIGLSSGKWLYSGGSTVISICGSALTTFATTGIGTGRSVGSTSGILMVVASGGLNSGLLSRDGISVFLRTG